MTISGDGFTSGDMVKLVGPGPDIVPDSITIGQSGRRISAIYDLTGKAQGLWDVVVENQGSASLIFSQFFTIETGRAPQVWVDIVGLDLIRPDRAQRFTVLYGNRGNVDAVGVPIWVAGVPSGGTLDLDFTLTLPPSIPGQSPIDFDGVPNQIVDTNNERVVPLIIPRVPAGQTDSFQIQITVPPTASAFSLNAWADPPFFRSPLNPDVIDCVREAILRFIVLPPGVDCLATVVDHLSIGLGQIIFSDGGKKFNLFHMIYAILKDCTGNLLDKFKLFKLAEQILDGILNAKSIIQSCFNAFPPPPPPNHTVIPVNSFDPNDKIGSRGAGSQMYLSGEETLRYSILFENLETATASAQEVVIIDQLDTNNVDLSSLSLGPITFGDKIITPPPGLKQFNTTVDLRPGNNLIVEINVGLDLNTGLLTWRFASVDPVTGGFPSDPTAGFLPPNVNSPEGSGNVLYTVMPKTNLITGTEIRNSASIVFDTNSPIVTPEWVNTIDNNKPQSAVAPLATTQTTADFDVQWSGSDVGAGIKDYTIYVSEDEGPFTIWDLNTPSTVTTFLGENGKTYSFYSVARDQTGNTENIPDVPDATTTVTLEPPPPGLIFVPDVLGQPQVDAETSIIMAGLIIGNITNEPSDLVIEGSVILQEPSAGTPVTNGSAVHLVISTGQSPFLDSDHDGRPDDNDSSPFTPEPNQCSGNNVVINSVIYGNGTVFDCRSQNTIETQGNVVIEMGADVLYMAPSLIFTPGFSVKPGGVFHGVGATQVAP